MRPDDVLAVVVSYEGAAAIRRAVEALRPQVREVLVVDNGSGAVTQDVLREIERNEGVLVERLGANLGIGRALNVGVGYARRNGFAWLLTMDQDSVVSDDLVAAYARAVDDTRGDGSFVCLTPTIEDEARPRERVQGVKSVRYAITSGNLVRVDLFERVGEYDETLFIDCVDFDFCLRLRATGYDIHRVADARMTHRLGEPSSVPAGVRKFYARHSPVRRYYMFRNYLYLAERHFTRYPWFVVKLGLLHIVMLPLVALYDSEPTRSFRAVGMGVRDYFARRKGAWMEALR